VCNLSGHVDTICPGVCLCLCLCLCVGISCVCVFWCVRVCACVRCS
jgi:hypothetical protein